MTPLPTLPAPTCPHARPIGGADAASAGVVCGAMERDQARADPILEGAPVGVVIQLKDDPSTLGNLCCGQGDPVPDPDHLRHRRFGDGHYTACPIFLADREIRQVEERLFGEMPDGPRDVSETFANTGEQELTEDEEATVRWLEGA